MIFFINIKNLLSYVFPVLEFPNCWRLEFPKFLLSSFLFTPSTTTLGQNGGLEENLSEILLQILNVLDAAVKCWSPVEAGVHYVPGNPNPSPNPNPNPSQHWLTLTIELN